VIKVGLTYDLRSDYLKMGYGEEETAEFDRDDTIDVIEETLQKLGYTTERIGNIKQLTKALVKGDKWDLVFNICEGMYGVGREAQVPALLDAYQIPYVFSNPLVLSLTLNKALTKRVIRDAGLSTPEFFVVSKYEDIDQVKIPFPLFAKPLAEGTGKGIDGRSVIKTMTELRKVSLDLLERFKQPVLVEKFLSGREFTVGIVGTGRDTRSTGTMEIILNEKAEKDVYSYINKEECDDLVVYKVPEKEITIECEDLAIAVWNTLGCEDGGRVDIRCDDNGVPSFIEVNPLAGLHHEHSDLPILSNLNGISFHELIRMIMDSAILKVSKK
jgi:D-alanine-D-alanine ligase